MERSMLVEYKAQGDECPRAIPLIYEKEDSDNIQLFRFRVDMPFGLIPGWLKPHKFIVRAMYSGNTYQPLLNETNGVHTLDAALFMEKAQAEVCLREQRVVTPARHKR